MFTAESAGRCLQRKVLADVYSGKCWPMFTAVSAVYTPYSVVNSVVVVIKADHAVHHSCINAYLLADSFRLYPGGRAPRPILQSSSPGHAPQSVFADSAMVKHQQTLTAQSVFADSAMVKHQQTLTAQSVFADSAMVKHQQTLTAQSVFADSASQWPVASQSW